MMRAGFAPEGGAPGPPVEAQAAQSSSRSATSAAADLTLISFPTFFMKLVGLGLLFIRTVSAAAPAAVAAPQVVAFGEDDVRALAVEVYALDGRPPLLQRL